MVTVSALKRAFLRIFQCLCAIIPYQTCHHVQYDLASGARTEQPVDPAQSTAHSVIVILADDTQLRQTCLILEIGSDLLGSGHDGDDVYHCIGERLKLEVETENMGV